MFMSFGYSDTMSITWLISSPHAVHTFFMRFHALRGFALLFAHASVGDFGDFAERGSRF